MEDLGRKLELGGLGGQRKEELVKVYSQFDLHSRIRNRLHTQQPYYY